VASELTVVKVGGSLYDLPDLGPRLRRWLETLTGTVVLVPGGGPTANAVRELDYWQNLGEEKAHWLALQALSLNAYFLADLLGQALVVAFERHLSGMPPGLMPILSPSSFALDDEGRPDHLPHTWDVTSDSVAARFAIVSGARSLVLLKSVTIPPEMTWAEASQLGFVDVLFPRLIEQAGPGLRVEAVNFREWRP
jgi:aspartokinase-like uncharacterized kinase